MTAPSSSAPQDLAVAIKGGGSGKHLKLYVSLAVVVLALGGGAWYWRSRVVAARLQLPPYATEVLRRGDISLTITATGTLAPTTEVTVGSELSGTTLEVYVDFNLKT